jgi:RNA polymerase sigma-70 factor (ECF subfamily)
LSKHLDDSALVQRIAKGDKDAMRALYEQYYDALYSFLRGRGATDQAASDSLQEAMLDVWRTAGRFKGQSSVKTWLFTIARNKQVDQIRKSARLSFVETVPEAVDTTPNAEQIIIAAADAVRVRACLDKLTPPHQTMMRLAFYEDMTYGEISEVEGVPEGTVKTRIYHAKRLLLRCLGRR